MLSGGENADRQQVVTTELFGAMERFRNWIREMLAQLYTFPKKITLLNCILPVDFLVHKLYLRNEVKRINAHLRSRK